MEITSKSENEIRVGDDFFIFEANKDGNARIWFKESGRGLQFGSLTKFVQMVNDFDALRRDHFREADWLNEEFGPTEWKNVVDSGGAFVTVDGDV